MSKVAVFTALDWEAEAVRRGRASGFVLTARGIGPAAARSVLERSGDGATDLLVAGCAGALRDDLEPGTLVIATELVTVDGRRFEVDEAWRSSLSSAAERAGIMSRAATVLSSPRVLALPAEKSRSAGQSGAAAVEMEGAAAAEWASTRGIRFAMVRAILDRADQAIPVGLVDSAGRPRLWALWRRLLVEPSIARDLTRLARAKKKCAVALTALFGELADLDGVRY